MGKSIQITQLSLQYHRKESPVLSNLDFEIEAGEIVSLVGPSGCGKSSLLRLIAGLEHPTSGAIHMNGSCLSCMEHCLPPEKRGIGLVTQSGDLFPHLTIAKNIAYGLNRKKPSERNQRVTELLQAIELPNIAKRYPAELSGGEAQRVALARALAPWPGVLLLDEPFSSLDRKLRERLRQLTASILREAGTTAIFVTHHEEDAISTGDRVVRLEDGKIAQ